MFFLNNLVRVLTKKGKKLRIHAHQIQNFLRQGGAGIKLQVSLFINVSFKLRFMHVRKLCVNGSPPPHVNIKWGAGVSCCSPPKNKPNQNKTKQKTKKHLSYLDLKKGPETYAFLAHHIKNLATSKNRVTEKSLKFVCLFVFSSSNATFSLTSGRCQLTPQNHITYNLRRKKSLKLGILAQQMQNILRQGGMQTPKIIYTYKFIL